MTQKPIKRDCTRTLKLLGACEEAVIWAKGKTLQEAWTQCKRGDWMFWLMAKRCPNNDATHRKLVLVACAIARTTLHLGPKNDPRPEAAIRVAERWGRGDDVSLEDRQRAWASAEASARANHANIIREYFPHPPVGQGKA